MNIWGSLKMGHPNNPTLAIGCGEQRRSSPALHGSAARWRASSHWRAACVPGLTQANPRVCVLCPATSLHQCLPALKTHGTAKEYSMLPVAAGEREVVWSPGSLAKPCECSSSLHPHWNAQTLRALLREAFHFLLATFAPSKRSYFPFLQQPQPWWTWSSPCS